MASKRSYNKVEGQTSWITNVMIQTSDFAISVSNTLPTKLRKDLCPPYKNLHVKSVK